jgi:hypothetical protein
MIMAARAIYKKGRLIFFDKTEIPKDGAEVVVTFTDDSKNKMSGLDAIKALRGSGKGEGLLDELLKSRQEDIEKDEESYSRLYP